MKSTNISKIKTLTGKTAREWVKHNPLLMAAAISYYIILSLGPITAIVILSLSEIFGKQAAEGQLVNEIQRIAGEKPSEIIQTIIQHASTSSYKTMAILSSIPLLFFGTTMVFFQVRNALNIIWDIKQKEQDLRAKIKEYSFSFIMLFIVGFLFFLLMLKSPAISYMKEFLNNIINMPSFLFEALNLLLNNILITILFAAVYKILLKAELQFKAALVGAAVTSVLFTFVQYLIGINAENSNVDSSLGAIGSFTILILWIYYSSLVFLFGACFTKVYSNSARSS